MPSITIYAGNDLQRLGEFRTAVSIAERNLFDLEERATKAPSARFGDSDPDEVRLAREAVDAAKAACDKFIDECAGRADEWVIEPIGHEAWRELLKAHPARMVPKKDGADGEKVEHEDDASWGVNTESFGKALLLFVDQDDADHRTVTKAGDTDLSELAKRVRRLPQGQFETLWVAAYHLNVSGVTDPKGLRYSTTPASSAT